MSKAFTISILLFFLADAIGSILFLFVDWYEIRSEMSHFLDSKQSDRKSTTLTFDNETFSALQWIEKDHEFFYEDKLYDVVSIHKQGDHTRIQCVADEREASLFKVMGKMVTHDESDTNGDHTFLLSVFKFLSSLVFQLFTFPAHYDMTSVRPLDAYRNPYQFAFHSFPLQPPDQFSFSI
jgi:hypothetical protein